MSHTHYIGIDPDIDKSGVAIWNAKENRFELLVCLKFFDLYDLLTNYHPITGSKKAHIVIEAGWLNKSNWHVNPNQSAALAAKIGNGTGQNHAVGMLIEQMCQYLGLSYELIVPKKSKVKDAGYFKALTGITERTNQEKRDAAMLVFGRK